MHGIESKDFIRETCNCHWNKTGNCNNNNICRHSMIVYQNTCKNTGKTYIGNTQQHFKKRMQQHNGDTRRQLSKGIKSDSFAKHFSHQMQNMNHKDTKVFHRTLRNSYTSKVLWQGKSISTVKTFGTKHCSLCSQERLHIFYKSKENPETLINSCHEIFGACRHKTRFHRYLKVAPSTDDSIEEEKVTPTKVTTEV